MALKFGLALMNDFPPDVVAADRIDPLRIQTRAAAEAGFDSVWMLQHYLGNMPTLQPLLALSAIAHEAGDMRLGTNMYILPLRHPVGVAEEFATLDHITGGRAVAGFGMGYRENEFAAWGIPLDQRIARYEESLSLVRALWSGDEVDHVGEYYSVKGEQLSLRPVQDGGPPIWIGAGAHRVGAQRAARLGDAWIIPPHVPPEKLARALDHYQAERERLNRPAAELVVRRELLLDPDPAAARELGLRVRGELTDKYAAFNAPDAGTYQHLQGRAAAEKVADESYLFTDPEGAIAALKDLERQGFTYIILRMQWYGLPQERVLQTMDMFRELVLPAFA